MQTKRILRAIAMGVPFVAAVGAPLWLGCACPGRALVELAGSDVDAAIFASDGTVDQAACVALCERYGTEERPIDAACYVEAGVPRAMCHYGPECGAGRRPPGFAASERDGSARSILASIAELEAASVAAFAQLAIELELHRAPPSLVSRARAAAGDERRHSSLTTVLATSYGALVRDPDITPCEPRTLEEIASDNAREGCVSEAFGALVANHQGSRAADPIARRIFARIAEDEARHAELSFDLAEWASTRLDRTANARVDRERSEALATLTRRTSAHALGEPAARFALGLPDVEAASRLAAMLA